LGDTAEYAADLCLTNYLIKIGVGAFVRSAGQIQNNHYESEKWSLKNNSPCNSEKGEKNIITP